MTTQTGEAETSANDDTQQAATFKAITTQEEEFGRRL